MEEILILLFVNKRNRDMLKGVLIISLFFGFISSNTAQFKGAVTAGISANQINGDGLAGFRKVGLTAGLSLFYPIKAKLDMGMEFLYTSRGSKAKSGPINSPSDFASTTHLDYIEVPIFVRIKDWYLEDDDYHKAFLDVGLSTGYLFNVSSDNELFEDDIGNFKKYDLSYLIGIGFGFSKRWSLGLRYTRGIIPVYKLNAPNLPSTVSYNWNLKVYYHL